MRSCCVVLLLLLHVADTSPKCGRPEVGRSSLQTLRVVGGMEAARGSQPWLVSLRNKALHFCGGAILTERWILTAAHCFASTHKEFVSRVTVAAGEHDRRVADEEEQILPVKSVRVHQGHRPSSPMSNDVALLELDGRVRFGVFVKPVCLPLPDQDSPPGSSCVVGGWGRMRERGRLPSVLRDVSLDLLHPARCRHVLQMVSGLDRNMTVLCAGPERGGRDACQGDSGSPLVCPAGGRWEVVGVTSWGKGCGRSWSNNSRRPPSRRGSPGVFTDVRLLLPWIKQTLRETPADQQHLLSSHSLCGVSDGSVHGEGFIRNPKLPGGRYGNNELCVWSISVADGFSVVLEFEHFDLENDSLCRHDRLSVLVDTHRPVVILCGSVSPARLLLNNSQSARLVFSSDVSDAGSGFVVRHLAVRGHPDLSCGSVVLLKDQVSVETPNYPQSYSEDCELRWVVLAPAGHIVKLEFLDFDVEESSGCSYDSLTVLADVEGSDVIASLCGRGVPPDVLSHQDVMVLIFSSDSSLSYRGFRGRISYISLSELNEDDDSLAADDLRHGPDQDQNQDQDQDQDRGSGPAHVKLEDTAPPVDGGSSCRRALVSDDEDFTGESSGHDL